MTRGASFFLFGLKAEAEVRTCMYLYTHVFSCVWARVSADPVLEAEAQVHAKPSPTKTAELTETGSPHPPFHL
jgi:hypothetical protein